MYLQLQNIQDSTLELVQHMKMVLSVVTEQPHFLLPLSYPTLTFFLPVELCIMEGVQVQVEEDSEGRESCHHLHSLWLREGQPSGQLL